MKYINNLKTFLNESLTNPVTVNLSDLDFEKHNVSGRMLLPSVTNSDAISEISNQNRLDIWKEQFIKHYGENAIIKITPNAVWFDRFKIIGNDKWTDQSNGIADWLKNK